MKGSLMICDPVRELQDLLAVHEFYVALLEQSLGHSVPVPADVMAPESSEQWIAHSIVTVKSWLNLLDLAITPGLMREGIKNCTKPETRAALLRYFCLKASTQERDRDKADFLASHSFRHSPAKTAGALPAHVDPAFGFFYQEKQAESFDKELIEMLHGIELPELPQEHHQLLRQFEFLYHQVMEFRSFNQLNDSGIIQRVRAIKQSFAADFYHPHVLSMVAVYNAFFSERFDKLFHEASAHIKSFALRIQESGGSIGELEDESTVKRLVEAEDVAILKEEYAQARDHFRQVSSLEKTFDGKKHERQAAIGDAARHVEQSSAAEAQTTPPRGFPASSSDSQIHKQETSPEQLSRFQEPITESPVEVCEVADASALTFNHAMEESKIASVRDAIRQFVRAADPKQAGVVPLPTRRVALAPPEVEAFRADYHEEQSFRGRFVSALMRVIAIHIRVSDELDSYNSKLQSAYLWKAHADSLAYLLTAGKRAIEAGEPVLRAAQERGLAEKVYVFKTAMHRLRTQAAEVAQALQK
jgi:hypothetical protein